MNFLKFYWPNKCEIQFKIQIQNLIKRGKLFFIKVTKNLKQKKKKKNKKKRKIFFYKVKKKFKKKKKKKKLSK